jgi:hypothetical protein
LLEIGMALAKRRFPPRILPVLYHVGMDPIPEMIKDRKAVDLNDFDEYLNEVRRRIERNIQ